MQVRDYLRAIRRGWILILLCLVVGISIGTAVFLIQRPVYSATSAAFVSTTSANNATDLSQGGSYIEQIVQSYANVALTPYILDPVINQLNLHETSDTLSEQISASAPVNTAILRITASAPSARLATEIANAVASQLASRVASLSPSADGTSSAVRVTIIQRAIVPLVPDSPNATLDIGAGLVLGLIAGLVIGVARDAVDTRLRNVADIHHITSSPILGLTSFDSEVSTRPNVVMDRPRSVAAESYRTIRTNLQFLRKRGQSLTFVVTSSIASEGKSVTSANLAIALAETGRKVVLVDADLRRPSVATKFGLVEDVGLTDLLIGEVSLNDATQFVANDSLAVITAGRIPPNPNELLQSDTMHELISELRANYDVIIFDTPPLLPVSDAAILAAATDGAVIAAAIGRVRRPQLQHAISSLEQVDANVLGILATMVGRRDSSSYGYSYEYEYGRNPGPEIA